MTKASIVILSDPKNGSEESIGRLFNALAAAYEFKQRGDDVRIYFQGTGTRWTSVLVDPQHPAHDLFESVRDRVAGVSCGCADVFDAREQAIECGFELLTNNPIPGTSGLSSLAGPIADGRQVFIF